MQAYPPASLGCDQWNGKVQGFGERSGSQVSCYSSFHLLLSPLLSVGFLSIFLPRSRGLIEVCILCVWSFGKQEEDFRAMLVVALTRSHVCQRVQSHTSARLTPTLQKNPPPASSTPTSPHTPSSQLCALKHPPAAHASWAQQGPYRPE